MKRKKISHDMPIGKLKRVSDFLPPPADLAISEETRKITLSIKKSSINFFKREANRYHTKYQRMIRELLDRYAEQYSSSKN